MFIPFLQCANWRLPAQPSTSRLAALAVNISRKKIGTRGVTPISNERESGDVNGHDRKREVSVAR